MTIIDLTVSDLAKLLQRSRSSITSLIQSGKLEAYDAAPDGRYRQWRVTQEALDKFREQNRARPAVKRRKQIAKPVKRYV
ncbi:MAG TPA: DNA-binding protein [Fuerstia sp.]|nr:DNA-binding protein [Fuerstiella sp.]